MSTNYIGQSEILTALELGEQAKRLLDFYDPTRPGLERDLRQAVQKFEAAAGAVKLAMRKLGIRK